MSTHKVNQLLLERYLAGELLLREQEQLDAQVAQDPELQTRLVQMRTDNQATLQRYVPRTMAAQIQARISERSRSKTTAYLWLVPVMSAATLALFAYERGGEDQGSQVSQVLETTRAKGLAPHLVVFRQRGHAAEELHDGAVAHAGDILQLSYVRAHQRFGVVLSVDGRGTVTLHYPATPQGSTRLEDEALVPLAQAYELDDAPQFERFFFVSSAAPIDVAAMLHRVEQSAGRNAQELLRLPVGPDQEQSHVTLMKVPQ